MKLSQSILLCALLAGASAHAMGPGPKGEIFDLITASVDDVTAAELTSQRDAIEALRDELRALRDSGNADQDTVAATRDELFTLRKSLRDQVHSIVDNNETLQDELRALAEGARDGRFGAMRERRDEVFNEIVTVATPEQADTLESNRAALEGLHDELRAARDAGATRDELSDLRASFRDLMMEQRELVEQIVDENQDTLGDVFDQARDARENGFGGRRGFPRPRPGSGS